jgi:hypothetical protein
VLLSSVREEERWKRRDEMGRKEVLELMRGGKELSDESWRARINRGKRKGLVRNDILLALF